MTNTLMISVSGIRGIIGESLTPEIITNFCLSYGTLIKGKTVIIGRDTRTSGDMVLLAAKSALMATGCKVIDVGIATTPTIEIMIEEERAQGGVMVSASHNPSEWNALKFFNSHGELMTEQENQDLMKIFNKKLWNLKKWNKIGSSEINTKADKLHIDSVLKHVNVNKIKKKKFKVLLDSINGAGGSITPILLKKLGCITTEKNTDLSGNFAHKPEPIKKNLSSIIKLAQKGQYDIVFIQDPDADRLVVIKGDGTWIGEEYTTSLCVRQLLKHKKGPVVVNLSTSKMNEDIALENGCEFYRSKVGEANVIQKMREVKSTIGGEGNGGIIAGDIHYGRDSLVGIALLLNGMAEGESLQDMIDAIPKYHMEKATAIVDRKLLKPLFKKLQKEFKNEKVDVQDGIRIDFKDSWVQLRASNTEPIVRIMAESKSSKETKALLKEFMNKLKK